MVRSSSSVRFPSAIVLLAVMALVATGQEPEKAVPEPVRSAIIVAGQSDGGGVFQVEAFGLDAPMMMLPSPSVGQMAFSFAGPGAGGAWADSVNWLNDEDLLNELGIVEEQRAELDRIREEVVQRRRDFFDFFRTVKPEKRGDFVKEFGELLVANVDKQVEQVLLPHQKKRLKEIQFQSRMRGMGVGALERDELMKELGITQEQLESLREKQKEVEEKLRKKLEELRKEAQNEVMSVLTEEQQRKIRGLMGKDYEHKPRPFVPPVGLGPKTEGK